MLNKSLSVSSTISLWGFHFNSSSRWRFISPRRHSSIETSLNESSVCANRFRINNVMNFSFVWIFIRFQLTSDFRSNRNDLKMLRVRNVLVLLTGIFLCETVRSEYNELSDLFNELNQELLNINHQTAQLAWDTK